MLSWRVTFSIICIVCFKGDVTWDDSQRRFFAQHSVAMLEQCCYHLNQCRNNVVTLCCAKNRRCESSRVTLRQSRADLMTFQKIDWNVRTFQGLDFRLITTFIVKITWRKEETFRFEDEDDHEYEIFASSQNIDFPESFILPFFFRKVSTVDL